MPYPQIVADRGEIWSVLNIIASSSPGVARNSRPGMKEVKSEVRDAGHRATTPGPMIIDLVKTALLVVDPQDCFLLHVLGRLAYSVGVKIVEKLVEHIVSAHLSDTDLTSDTVANNGKTEPDFETCPAAVVIQKYDTVNGHRAKLADENA